MAQFDDDAKRLAKEAEAGNAAIGVEPGNFGQAESFVNSLLSQNIFTPSKTQTDGSTMRPALSFQSYRTNIQNIVTELGREGKALKFILSQTALALLNPTLGQGMIVNPIALALGPIPYLGGITTLYVDVPLASMNPVSNGNADHLYDLYKGNKREFKIEAGIPPFSVSDPKTRVPSEKGNTDITLEKKFNQGNLAHEKRTMSQFTAIDPFAETNLLRDLDSARALNTGVEVTKPDYSKIFDIKKAGPDFGSGRQGFGYNAQIITNIKEYSSKYRLYENKQDNYDVYEDNQDLLFGYISSLKSIPDAISYLESKQVIPFFFSDLRMPERFVSFKAFLVSFGETLTPNWNEEEYMGRIDNVAIYKSTSRTFRVSFKIVAMSQEGLTAMWRKINNLCKMVYPTFTNGIIDKSPIVRMRVGDVCADGSGNGLPGKINSLSFTYDDSTWEIENHFKNLEWGFVPQFGTVDVDFTVIHESNPRNDSAYRFNFRHFRKAGK